MKRESILVAALYAASALVVQAGIVTFEHLPEANSSFVSHHAVGGPVLADDFDPAFAGSISRVEWWGTSAQSSTWEIVLHFGHIAGGFGQPQANPAAEGGKKYFVTATGTDTDGDGIFYFDASLPADFPVSAGPAVFGSEYWVSIANAADGWRWAFAGAGPTRGDEHWSGVVSTGSTPCGDGGPHCGAWSQIQGRDFAVRLEAIPEPGTWMLVVGGIAFILIGVFRRSVVLS